MLLEYKAMSYKDVVATIGKYQKDGATKVDSDFRYYVY